MLASFGMHEFRWSVCWARAFPAVSGTKTAAFVGAVTSTTGKMPVLQSYIAAIMMSANCEHFTSVAPSIWRAKS